MSKENEKISKLISYWLRHNPGDVNLKADDYGWVGANLLIEALSLNGYKTSIADLKQLNQSFDKVRWEFDISNSQIRATHGHSFPVVLTDRVALPPAILYHGTSMKGLSEILKNGLKSMQREFVHLSADLNVAIETAKRHGKPILIEIHAGEAAGEGIEFYQTSENVWLSRDLSNQYISLNPWHLISDQEEVLRLLNVLQSEVGKGHIVYEFVNNLKPIMRRHDQDDVLYIHTVTGNIYDVHLTYSRTKETNPLFPSTRQFESFDKWLVIGLIPDQKEWHMLD